MSTVVAGKSSSLGVADGDGSGLAASDDVSVSESPAAGVRNSSRLYYLDWIRVLALLLVFVWHLAGSLVPDGEAGIWAPLTSLPLLGIALFFVVSGAASMFSLERRTWGQFLRERVLRLGLPFLIGGALLVPLAVYLGLGDVLKANVYPDAQGSLWEFYGVWFSHFFENLSWQTNIFSFWGMWLWVLGFLFVYSVVGLPILQWLRSASADRFVAFSARLASHRGGVIVWVVPAVALAVVGEAVLIALNLQPLDPVVAGDFLYNGWEGLVRLFGIFLLGAMLVRNREVLGFVRRDWPLGLLTMVAVLGLFILIGSQPINMTVNRLVVQAGFTVAAWCFTLVVVAAGQRWLNRPGRLLAYSLGLIVAFYVLHAPVLAAVERVAFAWIGVDGSSEQAIWVLGLIVLVMSFVALIALIELVVRPIPPLRKFLGVTKERVPGQYNHKVTDHDQRAVDQDESANRPPERELVASGDNEH